MKLSIIIPCYNVAPYVERTVRSVQEQPFADWELILVDDGSTDGTLPVLQALAEKDCRICVIAQANRGVSAARNAGLRRARGEYVQFIDGDDYISSYGDVDSWADSDVVVYGFAMHTGAKTRAFLPPREWDSLLVKYLRGSRLHLGGFIFRRSLLEREGIFFDEQTYYSEDKEVMVKALLCARRVRPVRHVLYHYIRRPDSAMGEGKFAPKRLTSLFAMERVEQFVRERVGKNSVWANVCLNQGVSFLIIYRLFLKSFGGDSMGDNDFWQLLEGYLNRVMAVKYRFAPDRYSMLLCFFRLLYKINPSFPSRLLSRL